MTTNKNAPFIVLTLVLLLAFFIRVWGLDYGLPYEGITYNQVTFEESQEVLRAFKLGAGEYAWKFGKGGLYYILFLEYGIYYVVSDALGWVDNPREFALQIVEDRTPAYMMGRLTVAIMGVLTCLVVYRIGSILHDWRVGLGAAFLGATSYYHAIFSTVINVDIGMTLAFWSSLLFYLIYEQVRLKRYLVISGILGGICIAFKLPGAVIIPLIFVAVYWSSQEVSTLRDRTKDYAIFFLSLMSTLTIVAPEWVTGLDAIRNNFSSLLGSGSDVAVDELELPEAAKVVSAWGGSRWAYLRHLTKDYNLLLTIGVLVAAAVVVYRRNRWGMIIAGLFFGFIVAMSLADRTQAERYLLPIMPAAWLMASVAIFAIAGSKSRIAVAALLIIASVPSIHIAQSFAERQQPDTRVSAKHWIESNIPDGSKILMDGMRYRFIPSPPLKPSQTSLSAKVNKAANEGDEISRGVSDLALSVYKEAMEKIDGPAYELHSTEHGLNIQTSSYYVENCFDYVVTSSLITRRFMPGSRSREVSPKAAKFYDNLPTDPRFMNVYSIGPRPWVQSGPEINVYKVESSCAPS